MFVVVEVVLFVEVVVGGEELDGEVGGFGE